MARKPPPPMWISMTLEEYQALDPKRPLTDGEIGSRTDVKREADARNSRLHDVDRNDPYTELMEAALEGARQRLSRQRRPAESTEQPDRTNYCTTCRVRERTTKSYCAVCDALHHRRERRMRLVTNNQPTKEPA